MELLTEIYEHIMQETFFKLGLLLIIVSGLFVLATLPEKEKPEYYKKKFKK